MITCYFENKNKVGLRHIVISVIIVKDGKVLLEKRGTFNGKPILESGKWALTGGFVDRNETLVEAAEREVREETGWIINNLNLFRIVDNPNRPNDSERQNVSMIFTADAVNQKPMASEEVVDLKWFDLNNLPPREKIAFDHSDDLRMYKKYLKKKFALPVLG